MLAVTVQDANNSAEPFQKFRLHLASETLTVRELIERRVRREVEIGEDEIDWLVSITEKLLNKPPATREERLVETALRGFKTNQYMLFIDDNQVDSLTEKITLTPTSSILFLRLIPLQGG